MRRLSFLGSLGAITPDAAAKQVFPNAPKSSSAGHNMATYNAILASAQAGQLLDVNGAPAYIPGTPACAASGVSAGSVALTSIATVGAKIAPLTGPAAPFVLIGSAIVGLFGGLFAHHAAAVKKEQSVLCAAVPAANNYLQLIDQAVQTGQSSPQDGLNALASLQSGFDSQVASIRKGANPTVSGECNAACVMSSCLRAIILVKGSQYQDLAAQQAANPVGTALLPVSSAVQSIQSVITSAGLPSWLLPAAGFFALYELL